MFRSTHRSGGIRNDILNSDKITATIERLTLRITDRFPESGLGGVARTLHEVALETDRTIRWIARPNYWLRTLSVVLIIAICVGLVLAVQQVDLKDNLTLGDILTITEAAINELIILSAGIFFVISLEARRKRNRVIEALNQLRSIAHVIDAHQLTKDPDFIIGQSKPTAHSPVRQLSAYELSRYLDYCTELLALTGKVAFLFVQRFNDPAAESAANELESLTLNLSGKIWQKMLLLKEPISATDRPGNS